MNSEAIISRVRIVLEHYSLTSSTFADTIDVQRSSISHLMSGRNKPSLDFVMKIVDKFPEVDFYWLLNGKGNFPKIEEKIIIEKKETITEESKITPTLFSEKIKEPEKIISSPIIEEKIIPENINQNFKNSNNTKKLIKVILLYNDGSFEDFNK